MPAAEKSSSLARNAGIQDPKPRSRPLKVYAFDPAQGRMLGNEMSIEVRYEELDKGPVVKARGPDAIAIADYDGTNKVWYRPIDLDDPRILISGGLSPSEADPRFHQQMVYAVVTETIQHFEAALGRKIHWRRQERTEQHAGQNTYDGGLPGDIYTLNIYPHAMAAENAFYSPKAHGILFGYFRASKQNPGRNLPGQTVFTCLSHDVVVHETTHAIIDGIRPYFTEYTNPDVPALHEGFADIVALFRHFTHKEALLDTIQRTGGAIYQYHLQPEAMMPAERGKPDIAAQLQPWNPLILLAQQFGEATGRGRGLRSALGTKPNSDDIRKLTEPHARGSILVAAVFDAFFSIYVRRTADLFRIYRSGGGRIDADIPSSLAERLAREAAHTAEDFFQVCVRALDYCPPVDITYGDFLRALITTERDLRPVDETGMCDALMQAFRLRGIWPESASFFSEQSIAWPIVQEGALEPIVDLDFGDANGLSRDQKTAVAAVLKKYANTPSNKEKLGFDPALDVSVPSFHPVFRIDRDGSLRTDMVVQMVQRRDVPFGQEGDGLGRFPLRGGVTLLISKASLDPWGNASADATIRYAIGKHLHGEEGQDRATRQRAYCQKLGLMEGNDPDRFQIDFAMVHEGL